MQIPENPITLNSSSEIAKILAPLSELVDIHYFHYGVNYPDCSGFSLTTNIDYYKTWFDQQFPFCGFYLQNGWHTWNTTLPKRQLEVAEQFNIAHGVHFIRHHPDRTEIFGFGTSVDNKAIYDFYLNNGVLLRKFGTHFLQEGKDIITAAKNHLITPPKKMILKESKAQMLQDKLNQNSNRMKSLFEKMNYPFNLFSDREEECFTLLLQGLSNTEIGEELGLSPKTVHVYVERIKKKLNCETKQEIFIKAREAGFIEYYSLF